MRVHIASYPVSMLGIDETLKIFLCNQEQDKFAHKYYIFSTLYRGLSRYSKIINKTCKYWKLKKSNLLIKICPCPKTI